MFKNLYLLCVLCVFCFANSSMGGEIDESSEWVGLSLSIPLSVAITPAMLLSAGIYYSGEITESLIDESIPSDKCEQNCIKIKNGSKERGIPFVPDVENITTFREKGN